MSVAGAPVDDAFMDLHVRLSRGSIQAIPVISAKNTTQASRELFASAPPSTSLKRDAGKTF